MLIRAVSLRYRRQPREMQTRPQAGAFCLGGGAVALGQLAFEPSVDLVGAPAIAARSQLDGSWESSRHVHAPEMSAAILDAPLAQVLMVKQLGRGSVGHRGHRLCVASDDRS